MESLLPHFKLHITSQYLLSLTTAKLVFTTLTAAAFIVVATTVLQFLWTYTLTRLIPITPKACIITTTVGAWHFALLSLSLTSKLPKLRSNMLSLEVIFESIFFYIEVFLVPEGILGLLLKDAKHVSLDLGGGDPSKGTPNEAAEEDWIVFFDIGRMVMCDGSRSRGCRDEESSEGVGDLHMVLEID